MSPAAQSMRFLSISAVTSVGTDDVEITACNPRQHRVDDLFGQPGARLVLLRAGSRPTRDEQVSRHATARIVGVRAQLVLRASV
jgi:hypothetical protein